MTGSTWQRKGLEELLEFVRSGDTVIVRKLDRLGRSLKNLIETLNLLNHRGVNFISLTGYGKDSFLEQLYEPFKLLKLVSHPIYAITYERASLKKHR